MQVRLDLKSMVPRQRRQKSLLTLLSAPDLYTASARFRVAFPLEYRDSFVWDGENESNLLKTTNTEGSKRKLEITNLDHLDHAYVVVPARWSEVR